MAHTQADVIYMTTSTCQRCVIMMPRRLKVRTELLYDQSGTADCHRRLADSGELL